MDAVCEFSHAVGRSRCALKDKFQALNVRKGHKRSIVALGHKMLRTIYAMLSKNTHYMDKTVDYEALMVARNAPRWLQMLLKEARNYSARLVITWLGRSTALVFLQIFPIVAAKTALQPIPTQAPRFHVNQSALP